MMHLAERRLCRLVGPITEVGWDASCDRHLRRDVACFRR